MTPDLPVELWLLIISLLPRDFRRKMIGINRTTFEIGMNDLYEEVRFISCNQRMLGVFDQLRYVDIARRVRHFYIRPSFLPSMDECTEYKSDGGGVLFASPTFQTPPEGGLFRKVTHAAGEAMCNCSNLQEVTIVLHDHCSLPTFTSFLSTLWTSLASSIRRLNMDVTLEKLQTLLLPLVMSPNVFLGLEELHIDIATSRFHISVDHKILIADLLLPFLNRLKSTLKSLALSSSEYLDLTPIFCGLEQFPALHSLEIFTTFSSLCLSEPSALTRVLQLHKQTLQQFSLTPRPRVSTTSRVTDSSYDRWLEQDLSKLVLPNLRKLEINQVPFIGYIRPFSVTVPDLRGFSTSLTSLTMVNYFLEIDGLNALCASLTSHPGRNCLETLRIDVQFLSSSIFDLLDAKLSRLEELDLQYAQMDVTVNSFLDQMGLRTYPEWGLRILRISTSSYCGMGHYSQWLTETVAGSIPSVKELRTENHCFCF